MSTPREELHELVEGLPDEQVPATVSDLRDRLASRGATSFAMPSVKGWPPAWLGIAEGSTSDASERVEEILAEGLGRRGA